MWEGEREWVRARLLQGWWDSDKYTEREKIEIKADKYGEIHSWSSEGDECANNYHDVR